MRDGVRCRMSVAGIAGLCLLLLLGTFGGYASETNELVVAQASGMTTWDPHDDIAVHVTNIKRNVYETLVRRDATLTLVPGLATEWEIVDEDTWRFYLREGVEFHNGEEFDATDVKWSLERLLDPELALHARSFIATVASVEIVDDFTVDIHTHSPDPVLPSRLAFCGFIAPSQTVQELGMDEFVKNPIGTGPYRFVEWERDVRVALERNEDYWGPPAKTERLIFRPIAEVSTRMASLRLGEVDIAVGVPPDLVSEVEAYAGVEVIGVRSATNIFFILNANVPPFDDKRVRQAMNYAVDVDAMIEYLLDGRAYRLATVGPAWFGAPEDQTPYPYDPVRARELLTAAGYPAGFETKMVVCPTRPQAALDVSQATADYLRAVGVTVEIETHDYGSFLDRWRAGEDPMYYFRFGTPVLDMDDVFGSYFDPERRSTWYEPPEELAEVARSGLRELDPDKRVQIYAEFLEGIKEEAPWIFLWNFEDLYGVRDAVKGFVPRADELMSLRDVYKE